MGEALHSPNVQNFFTGYGMDTDVFALDFFSHITYLSRRLFHAALAQLVEHIIRNDRVRCSSHLSGTTISGITACALAY